MVGVRRYGRCALDAVCAVFTCAYGEVKIYQTVCAAFGFKVSNCCAAEATCTDFTRAVRIDSVAVSVDRVVVSKSRSDSLLALCCMAI